MHSLAEVFYAINNVRDWWLEELDGKSEKLSDVFSYRHGDIHYFKHQFIEVENVKKMVWLTLDTL